MDSRQPVDFQSMPNEPAQHPVIGSNDDGTIAEAPNEARKRKRERAAPEGGEHADYCWGLAAKYAALTRDSELLSQEVAKVRREADLSSTTPELTPEEKAMLAERHAKKLADVQKRGVSVMLRDIMGHKWAFPFNKPVDMLMYKDYLSRVSKPMDFGTIKTRLEAGMYAMNTAAFAGDMRQVFTNAFTYNAPSSDVYSMATTLQDKFEERLKGLTSRMAVAESERVKSEDEMKEHARRRLQEKALEGLAEHRARLEPTFAALEKRIGEAKGEAAQGCAFMPLDEKRALVDALAELKLEEFEFAMQLVVNRHPGLLQPGSEEMDIDLEPLDALTLRQLAAFCRFCVQGRGGPAGLAWPGLVFGSGARASLPPAGCDQAAPREPRESAAWSPPDSAAPPQPPLAAAGAGGPREAGPAVDPSPMALREEGGPVPAAPPPMQPMVQVRSIGERSWSVLDGFAASRERREALGLPRPAAASTEPPGPAENGDTG